MTTTTPRSTVSAAQAELDALLAELLPRQGAWDAAGYLWLTDRTTRLVEFTDGSIEVLPLPTDKHQAISQVLFLAFLAAVRRSGGRVFSAPLRLRIREGGYREPALLLLRDARDRGDPRRLRGRGRRGVRRRLATTAAPPGYRSPRAIAPGGARARIVGVCPNRLISIRRAPRESPAGNASGALVSRTMRPSGASTRRSSATARS